MRRRGRAKGGRLVEWGGEASRGGKMGEWRFWVRKGKWGLAGGNWSWYVGVCVGSYAGLGMKRRTALEKTSMAPKSVCVVSVEMGPRSVVLGRVWADEVGEVWRVRCWCVRGWWECGWWVCGFGRWARCWRSGWVLVLMVSVARRARRRWGVGVGGGMVVGLGLGWEGMRMVWGVGMVLGAMGVVVDVSVRNILACAQDFGILGAANFSCVLRIWSRHLISQRVFHEVCFGLMRVAFDILSSACQNIYQGTSGLVRTVPSRSISIYVF